MNTGQTSRFKFFKQAGVGLVKREQLSTSSSYERQIPPFWGTFWPSRCVIRDNYNLREAMFGKIAI